MATQSDATPRGYSVKKDDYIRRLNRIEGQVRGLRRMIDEDTYCIDVLTQVSAVTKALQVVAVGCSTTRPPLRNNAGAEGDPEASTHGRAKRRKRWSGCSSHSLRA